MKRTTAKLIQQAFDALDKQDGKGLYENDFNGALDELFSLAENDEEIEKINSLIVKIAEATRQRSRAWA